jgi:hypothetical protein
MKKTIINSITSSKQKEDKIASIVLNLKLSLLIRVNNYIAKKYEINNSERIEEYKSIYRALDHTNDYLRSKEDDDLYSLCFNTDKSLSVQDQLFILEYLGEKNHSGSIEKLVTYYSEGIGLNDDEENYYFEPESILHSWQYNSLPDRTNKLPDITNIKDLDETIKWVIKGAIQLDGLKLVLMKMHFYGFGSIKKDLTKAEEILMVLLDKYDADVDDPAYKFRRVGPYQYYRYLAKVYIENGDFFRAMEVLYSNTPYSQIDFFEYNSPQLILIVKIIENQCFEFQHSEDEALKVIDMNAFKRNKNLYKVLIVVLNNNIEKEVNILSNYMKYLESAKSLYYRAVKSDELSEEEIKKITAKHELKHHDLLLDIQKIIQKYKKS